jgi:nucleoside-diphosphate-sugar epimerase
MHVLIIGGTRFIGRFIVEKLIEHGHRVSIFHRGRTEPESQAMLEHFHGERRALPEWRDRFRAAGIDAVIDMIAMNSGDARIIRDTFTGFVRKALVVSSADVYKAWEGVLTGKCLTPVPLREDSALRDNFFPYKGKFPGGDTYDKILVEREFIEYSNGGDLPANIVRLPMVYGPHDPQKRTAPHDELAFKSLLKLGPVREWNWLIHRAYVGNIAESAVKVLETGAPGEIYNLADSTVVTMGQWIEAIGHFFGVVWDYTGPVIDDPESGVEGSIPDLQHVILDCSKVVRDCGYREIVTPEEGLNLTLEWRKKDLLTSSK